MESDFRSSLEFLELIYPDGPWMLTAIAVDKKSIDARTFTVAERDEVIAWLRLHEKRNLYYSVNEPVRGAWESRKLRKSEVARAHFLHVDVDPRAGEDVRTEQERILAQIQAYRVPPTVLVFSGGGYNALWRLDEPVCIAEGSSSEEESVARALDFERRNWQLELDFSTPDHCRDVCRILRLPGTINRPNAEKIAKGRELALARVVQILPHSYPLSQFMATPVQASNAGAGASRKITADAARVESLDQLKIPEKLKVIIAQGFDPEAEYQGDRSAVLYYVCCELVRQGISDEVILGIITDSRYLISASVLDKGSGVTRYALRQIARARDNADNPLLAAMNEEYAVIMSLGGTVMIESPGEEPLLMSFRNFRDRIKHYPKVEVRIGEKVKYTTAYEWWTSHPRRRMYGKVVFEPGLETPDDYNVWSGFSVQPVPGDRHLRFLKHVRDNICGGDEENYQYLIRWMARVVQQPRTQSMVAVVLLGTRGTGKSIFCNFFGTIFEPHTHTVADTTALTGKFNAHLERCVFVVAEEAFDLKDKRHESVLKEIITGRSMSVERKNVDRFKSTNYIHLVMTSNNERVVPAGDHERRFLVLRVANPFASAEERSAYFTPILEDQRMGGVANLLHHLMSIDLTGFNVTHVPKTTALREQQEHNLSFEHEWLLSKLETGRWFGDGRAKWTGPVLKKELHADYLEFMRQVGARYSRGERSFHKMIMQELPGTRDQQIRAAGNAERPMAFYFPSLEDCRRAWDSSRGWRTEWREPTDGVAEEAAVIPLAQGSLPEKEPF